MTDFNKQIEALQEQAQEYAEATEDVLMAKTNLTGAVLATLMTKFLSAIDESLEGAAKKQYYDKDLASTIKTALESVLTEISKQKAPQIDFKPNINIDLSSVRAIAEDIGKKNDSILALINKMQSNGNPRNEELMNLVATMIGKQNVFFDRTFKQMDYTEGFKQIATALNKKEDKIDKLVPSRGHNNLIDEVKVIYK